MYCPPTSQIFFHNSIMNNYDLTAQELENHHNNLTSASPYPNHPSSAFKN